jgi:hypothetical protein
VFSGKTRSAPSRSPPARPLDQLRQQAAADPEPARPLGHVDAVLGDTRVRATVRYRCRRPPCDYLASRAGPSDQTVIRQVAYVPALPARHIGLEGGDALRVDRGDAGQSAGRNGSIRTSRDSTGKSCASPPTARSAADVYGQLIPPPPPARARRGGRWARTALLRYAVAGP